MNYVDIRVFSKEGEDENKIIEALKSLCGPQKVRIDVRTAYGFDEKKIHILKVRLKSKKSMDLFLETLLSNLEEGQKKVLLKQLSSRLDESLNFFIRLDKDSLLNGGYALTDTGNCFHIKMNIKAYPHKKEVAVDKLKELFY